MTNVLDSLGRIKIVTGSGGNVWPKADKVNIGATEYPTFAAAVAALVSGDNPIVGEGTYSSSNLTISTDGELVGSGTQASLVSNSLSGFQQLTITATNYIIRQLKFAVTATTDSDISALILGGASKTHRLKNVEILHDATGIVGAVGQCVKLASMSGGTVELQDCYLKTVTTTGSVYTLKTSTNGTVIINGGLYDGKLFIDSGATVKFINLPQITGTVTITAGATVTGPYLDGSGNVIFPNAVGQSGGVWLYKADGLRVKYADYDNAYTAAGTGDTIYFFNGAYSFSANKAVGKSIIIEGQSAQGVTITNSVANSSAFDVTADNVTFRNLTIVSTGASTSTGCISTDNANLIIENCILNKSSGAATTGYALWMYGGTATIINSVLSATSGTSKYGIYNTTVATAVTVRGGTISGTTADIFSDQSGSTFNFDGVALLNNKLDCAAAITGFCLDSKYRNAGFVALNNSGGTRAAGDVCDIDSAGKLTTTTTAKATINWTVVAIGNTSANPCFVRRQGRATCGYTGTDPSAGNYLVTSTSGGLGQQQTTMHYAAYAVCTAAGSSGLVEVELLTGSIWVELPSATRLYRCAAHSSTAFTATINGAPSATSVVYNAPSAGSDNVIKPQTTGFLGEAVLWNTTRGTGRLISNVNTGTKTITTESTTDSWASGDTITIESQTVTTGAAAKAVEIDLSLSAALTAIPALARGILLSYYKLDTGAAGQSSSLHPLETYAGTKLVPNYNQVASASVFNVGHMPVSLINRRFCYISNASGSGTADDIMDLIGYYLAAP